MHNNSISTIIHSLAKLVFIIAHINSLV